MSFYLDHPRPLAFAHRGGALEAEENTIAAFAHAVELGFRYIETDVQATSDGVPVLFHDDTLRRITGAKGCVADYTFDELSRLRTRTDHQIPSLDEVLARFPETCFNLEPKTDDVVAPLAEVLRRHGAIDRIGIGCFEMRRTMRLRELLGREVCWSPSRRDVFRVWLEGWGVPQGSGEFACLQVPPRFRGIPVVSRRFVEAAHARGVQVHVWTIDAEDEMERLLDLGVDGLMTDRPSLLKRVLQRRGEWH
jgi:glycerophosphoryl diester phosphodiesterase